MLAVGGALSWPELLVALALASALVCVAWALAPLGAWWLAKRAEAEAAGGAGGAAAEEAVDLSVVVLTRNEERRLANVLDEAVGFLQSRSASRGSRVAQGREYLWELVVVDMGSLDGSCAVVKRFADRYGGDAVRLVPLGGTLGAGGKGLALRKGSQRARGRSLLVMDAGAGVAISELQRLEEGMARTEDAKSGQGLVFASRAHLLCSEGPNAELGELQPQRSRAAWFLVNLHRALFTLLCADDVFDAELGFRLITRSAARRLLPNVHLQSAGADAELVYLAEHKSVPFKEMAVEYKVQPAPPGLLRRRVDLVRDLIVMRLAYLSGLWSYSE
jgi:dolichyl-phosphate beta-glucosyltransferase